jgi:alpha-glucosidase (family GH31 glycosyl hydrolase)
MMKLHLEGGAFYKPLFFEFPNDVNAFFDQEQNIMLGDALKLGVGIKLGKNATDFYYPSGRWCSINYLKGCLSSNG